jgi:hypothetical protein
MTAVFQSAGITSLFRISKIRSNIHFQRCLPPFLISSAFIQSLPGALVLVFSFSFIITPYTTLAVGGDVNGSGP